MFLNFYCYLIVCSPWTWKNALFHSWCICYLKISCTVERKGKKDPFFFIIGKCLLFPAAQILSLFSVFCFSVPPPSVSSKIFKLVIKATFLGLLGYGCYRIGHRTVQFVLSMPATQPYLQRLTEVSQQWTWSRAWSRGSVWRRWLKKGWWRQHVNWTEEWGF